MGATGLQCAADPQMSGTNKKLSWFPNETLGDPDLRSFSIHLTENNVDGLTLFLTAGVRIGKMTPILRSKQRVVRYLQVFVRQSDQSGISGWRSRVVLVSCDWKG